MVKMKLSEAISKVKKGIAKKARGVESGTEKGLDNITSGIAKLAKKTMKSRRVFKKSEVSLKLKDREIHSILRDPNRFFKSEMEETKKSLYFQ